KVVRWVQTNPEMVPGRGTPLESYLTMRQMRILEAQPGGPGPAGFTGPRVVRLSTIINVKTILQLAQAERAGVARNQAILRTHSVQYANNSIVQQGGRIAAAVVEEGSSSPAGNVGASPELLAEFGVKSLPELLAKFGLSPTDEVLQGFDIALDVVP